MMRIRILIYLIFLSCIVVHADELPSWAKGHKGIDLLNAVKSNCHPQQPIVNASVNETILLLDTQTDGTLLNRFSTENLDASNFELLSILPDNWFATASANEMSFITTDLYNIFPCDEKVGAAIGQQHGPGVPEVMIRDYLDNGVILVGELENGVGVWSFPEQYKGEIARAFLYMAAIYPMTQWGESGINFLDEFEPLIVKEPALSYLLACHLSSPPTQREIERNREIGKIQGNFNPFVQYPALVSLIWDENSPDNPSHNNPGEEDPELEQRGALKAVYTMADEWIWLRCEYVAESAQWTVDGTPTTKERIPVSSLTKGRHILEYNLPTEKGRITIEVK